MTEIIVVCLAALMAGFIDAIVGGGGLVQTPVLFMMFPQYPVATLLGTTKLPSFSGTTVSLVQFSRHVHIQWKLVTAVGAAAFCAALAGSTLATLVTNEFFKPVILVALVIVAIYTYTRRDFGQKIAVEITVQQSLIRGILSGLVIGFYDGFIGPGTGSFLVLVFVSLLGFDFLHASAHGKMVNLAANVASILYFGMHGHILYELAVPMAVCNMAGGFAGTRLALAKGNRFIRIFFLTIVCATILRFAYDVFVTSI